MMISYFELLEMVKNENAPKKVKLGRIIYTWDEKCKEYDFEDDYENYDGLVAAIADVAPTEGRLIFQKVIEIID